MGRRMAGVIMAAYNGTVFAVDTDGGNFTNLFVFSNTNGSTATDLISPAGNTLHGMTLSGGTGGYGVVYRINMDGTAFTNLHNFTNDHANAPYQPTGLLYASNRLYGAAAHGGANGSGIIFAMNTDGSRFTNLHDFSGGNYDAAGNFTNEDGTGLICFASRGNVLYASASGGGSEGAGNYFSGSILTERSFLPTFTIFLSSDLRHRSGPIYQSGWVQSNGVGGVRQCVLWDGKLWRYSWWWHVVQDQYGWNRIHHRV